MILSRALAGRPGTPVGDRCHRTSGAIEGAAPGQGEAGATTGPGVTEGPGGDGRAAVAVSTSRMEVEQRFRGGPLVLDGAFGTELERRGVPTPAPLWSAEALWTAPEVVRAIHRDYVAAGADILVANTFRTNPRTLSRAGRLAEGAGLNARAVEMARAAADRGGRSAEGGGHAGLVAASVGPVEDCYRPELVPAGQALAQEHGLMMVWLAAAQPDLVWIETINTVQEARCAARAAAERGLPFVISLVLAEHGRLLSGEPLAHAVAAVEPFEPLAIGVNCVPARGITGLLRELRQYADRPLVAYGHIGNARPIRGWSYAHSATPAEYGGCVRAWLEAGAAVVGGCCGTTPAHVAAVRGVVDDRGRDGERREPGF